MTEERVATLIATLLGVEIDGAAVVRLHGGSLNEAFRVRIGRETVIAKHAPPFVAADPTIPLSQRRLQIEAQLLRELGHDGRVATVPAPRVRAPRFIAFDPAASLPLMEDLGDISDLGSCDDDQLRASRELGNELGTFVARLHAAHRVAPDLVTELDNRDVHETRYRVQYAQVGRWLSEVPKEGSDHLEVGAAAEQLGRRFLEPGTSIVMGDLWLKSVLVTVNGLRVIDRELGGAGHPAQDLGHLLAHLWMHAHRSSRARASSFETFRDHFTSGYREEIMRVVGCSLSLDVIRDANRHAGAEILARILGPFRSGFLYDGLSPDDSAFAIAIDVACRCLRDELSLFDRQP